MLTFICDISPKPVSGAARDETLKDARITSASPTTRELALFFCRRPESDSRRLDLVVIDRGQREDRDMFHCAGGTRAACFRRPRLRLPLKLFVNYGLKTMDAKVPANSAGPIP